MSYYTAAITNNKIVVLTSTTVGIHWDTVKRGITTTHVSSGTIILFFIVVVIIVVIIVVKYIVSACSMINNDDCHYLLIKMPVLLYIKTTDVNT